MRASSRGDNSKKRWPWQRGVPPTGSRLVGLWLIAGGLAFVASGTWLLGSVLDSPILRFIGFMTGASTFVPLPADAYVLDSSTSLSALTIGVVGGAVNSVAVLAERAWLLRLMDLAAFDGLKRYVGRSRWAGWAERHMFAGLVIGGCTFLPFEPFRLLAVLRNYHLARYGLATFLGRGTRYFILAAVGLTFAELNVLGWMVIGSLAVFALGLGRQITRAITPHR